MEKQDKLVRVFSNLRSIRNRMSRAVYKHYTGFVDVYAGCAFLGADGMVESDDEFEE